VYSVSASDVIKYIQYLSREASLEKLDLLRKHVQLEVTWIPQNAKQTLEAVKLACPCESVREFAIGPYRIDLYFPEWKVAVECDEDSHQGYDPEKEAQRTEFISFQLNCGIIRYDCNNPNFNVFKVIRKLFEYAKRPSLENPHRPGLPETP
jgi:very-short-patch-repair endonuclease